MSFFSKDHPGSISNGIKKINLLSNSQEIYLNGKNPYDINHLNKLIDETNFGTILSQLQGTASSLKHYFYL